MLLHGFFADSGQTLTKQMFRLNKTGWLANMCLKSPENHEQTVVIALLNGSLAYFEHAFTNQSGQIEKSLHYNHDDHFIKNYLLNFSN